MLIQIPLDIPDVQIEKLDTSSKKGFVLTLTSCQWPLTERFWTEQKAEAMKAFCDEERIKPAELEKLIKNYLFANRLPLGQDIINSLEFQPKILERKTIVERITERFNLFIETFIEGMGGIV